MAFSFSVPLLRNSSSILPASSSFSGVRPQLRRPSRGVREARPAPRFEVVAEGQHTYDNFDPFYVKEKECAQVVFNITNYLTAKRLITELDESEATTFRAFFNAHSLRRDPEEFAQDLVREHPLFGMRFFAIQEEIVEAMDHAMVQELLLEGLEKGKIDTLRSHLRETSFDNPEPTSP